MTQPGPVPCALRALLTALLGMLTLASLGAALGLESSLPQERERDPQRAFEALKRRLDKNFDGRISAAEWTRPRRAFRRLDRDGDGFLTLADFAAPKEEAEAQVAGGPGPNGQAVGAEALKFFETSVRPVLASACYACHSESASRLKGGLRVDSRAALLVGGHSGPAIAPGDVEGSPLIEAVRYHDALVAMPPSGKLEDEQIADIEAWVRMGAPWPAETIAEDGEESGLNRDIDIEAGKSFWSFQPIERTEPPAPRDADWALGDIDRFIRAAQESAGLDPAADASDSTWLRRVTFDLTGLPPTPEELESFEADRSKVRYEAVVDRLLASPAFGERFGRHWLDVARYGESSGKEANVVYPHAWRYRDWVIDAFAGDMPFDEFLTKQIAGDLLPADNARARAQNQIATGYLALGTKSHSARDPRQFKLDLVDEQIDALSQGMLGLTISCARCHDHKFDPIRIEDYYGLAGILMSSETLFGTVSGPGNRQSAALVELPKDAELPNGPSMDPRVRRLLGRARGRAMDDAEAAVTPGTSGDDMAAEDERRQAMQRARRAAQRGTIIDSLLSRFDGDGSALPANLLAMGMAEAEPVDLAVLERGELDRPRGTAARGVPLVLRHGATGTIESGSGRMELADWITSPQNPLTARVWANRVWLHLFGQGLVRTPDNFGAGGAAPDHPELLDWLSAELMENGWSTKALVRQVALSRAYRMDSKHDPKGARVDPEVTLLWRMPERRLEAEALRDAMLSVSGLLRSGRPVGSPTGTMEGAIRGDAIADLLTKDAPVRSVYMPVLRGHATGAMDAFDAPDAAVVAGAREVTTVATQALYLMNDEDVLRMSDAFAARLLAMGDSEAERIAAGFVLALGRTPSRAERRAVAAFLDEYEDEAKDAESKLARRGRRGQRTGQARRAAWAAFAQSLFQSAEFRTQG